MSKRIETTKNAVRHVLPALLALALAAGPVVAAGGKKTRPGSPDAPGTRLTPRQVAEDLYDRGLEARDKALRYSAEAAEASSERRRAKLEQRATKQFRRAAELFRESVGHDPDMHQSYASLGFALRNLGQLEPSLRAYDRALQLSPGYAEAIEYRAEAYLGLGRLAEAREAYMDLFRRDPPLAGTLLRAMRRWLEENPGDAAVGKAERDAFAEWVSERERLSGNLGDDPAAVRDW